MTYNIELKTKEDVMKLNKEASKQPFDIFVSYGNVTVDARSLLALFTIIGKCVNLVAPDHVKPDKFSKFVEKLDI